MPNRRLYITALNTVGVAAASLLCLAACAGDPVTRQANLVSGVTTAATVRAAYCAATTPEARAAVARRAGLPGPVISCP